jgi:signal transduction histidine kinase
MSFERHHLAWLVASATTVACFVGATAYTQQRLATLDALTSTLEKDAIPSIDYLARSGVRLTKLNQLLDELQSNREGDAVHAEARQELTQLERDVTQYLALPPLPRERAGWGALRADIDRAMELSRTAFDSDPEASGAAARNQDAEDALDKAVGSILNAVNDETADAERMARNVRGVRARTLQIVVGLDVGSVLVAALAVLLAFRASRAHEALLAQHASLLSARVAELDSFAGRVAHDIRNPLSTVATGLTLLSRSADESGRGYIERSQRAIARAHQLVDGLLAFARSGAHPDAREYGSIDTVLAGLGPELSDAAAEHGIAFACEIAGPMPVRCAPGVIASVIQNLVRNAIKYMGSPPVKRIDLSARAVGSNARIEVVDTGPGIPPELQLRAFEPFVRGTHAGIDGSGLGLATVKRLVESHGGRVGLESRLGAGTRVWIDLPLVADRSKVSGTMEASSASR